jgi:hypothetical protein
MWAVIHYLKTWGHYIGSKDVVVWTDNVTLKYFTTQPKLSSHRDEFAKEMKQNIQKGIKSHFHF